MHGLQHKSRSTRRGHTTIHASRLTLSTRTRASKRGLQSPNSTRLIHSNPSLPTPHSETTQSELPDHQHQGLISQTTRPRSTTRTPKIPHSPHSPHSIPSRPHFITRRDYSLSPYITIDSAQGDPATATPGQEPFVSPYQSAFPAPPTTFSPYAKRPAPFDETAPDDVHIFQPLYWDRNRRNEIERDELTSIPKLSKILTSFPPHLIPQQIYLPIFMHYQRDPTSDGGLIPYQFSPNMKPHEMRKYLLFQTIIPHHFVEHYINGPQTQTFHSYPSQWSKKSFSSVSIPISLSSDAIGLLRDRQWMAWNAMIANPREYCNLFTTVVGDVVYNGARANEKTDGINQDRPSVPGLTTASHQDLLLKPNKEHPNLAQVTAFERDHINHVLDFGSKHGGNGRGVGRGSVRLLGQFVRLMKNAFVSLQTAAGAPSTKSTEIKLNPIFDDINNIEQAKKNPYGDTFGEMRLPHHRNRFDDFYAGSKRSKGTKKSRNDKSNESAGVAPGSEQDRGSSLPSDPFDPNAFLHKNNKHSRNTHPTHTHSSTLDQTNQQTFAVNETVLVHDTTSPFPIVVTNFAQKGPKKPSHPPSHGLTYEALTAPLETSSPNQYDPKIAIGGHPDMVEMRQRAKDRSNTIRLEQELEEERQRQFLDLQFSSTSITHSLSQPHPHPNAFAAPQYELRDKNGIPVVTDNPFHTWVSTRNNTMTQLNPLNKKLFLDPWGCDMVRFDTTTTTTVVSPKVIDYDIRYDVMVPPVLNYIMNSAPNRVRSLVGRGGNDVKVNNNSATIDGGQMPVNTGLMRKIFHSTLFRHPSRNNKTNDIGTSAFGKKKMGSSSDSRSHVFEPFLLSVEDKTTLLPHYLSNYSPSDPLVHPTSHVYSFPLKWRRYKYIPFALPRDFDTVRSVLIILNELVSAGLKQFPSMTSPAYPSLFKLFPVEIYLDLNLRRRQSMLERGGYDSAGFAQRNKERSRGSTTPPDLTKLSKSELDQIAKDKLREDVAKMKKIDEEGGVPGKNLYVDFSNFELIHAIAPLYPQSQPPRDTEFTKQRRKVLGKAAGLVIGLAILDWVL